MWRAGMTLHRPGVRPNCRTLRHTCPVNRSELEAEDEEPAVREGGQGRKRRRSRWFLALAPALALLIAGTAAITLVPERFGLGDHPTAGQSTPGDSDGDGLLDEVEEAGWVTQDGSEYRTDPRMADSDGDGLTDADEAGELVTESPTAIVSEIADGGSSRGETVYAGFSNPLVADSDEDGLGDAQEADESLDPFDRDSDDDEIEDGPEVEVVGTSPAMADTDGDGFNDGYEEAHHKDQGLDPQRVDVKVSKLSYATDFAIGSVAGDAWQKDSFAWLAGNLASSGSSSIPVIGWIVGPLADARDSIASAIRGDWVSSGFSAVGAIPYAGDAVEIPGKAVQFVARNPELAAAVAAAIVAINKIPEKTKIGAAQGIWKGWDDLRSAGFSEKALLQLSQGATNLDNLADAMKRANHVHGAPAKFFNDGYAGEAWLTGVLKGSQPQARVVTDGCVEICNRSNVRIIDNLLDGVAHESKVGFKYLTPELERQIRSDAHLIQIGSIKGAHWHFLPSAHTNKLGAHEKVLDLLDELGIPYTIHPPA